MTTFDPQMVLQTAVAVGSALGLFATALQIVNTYIDIGDKLTKRRKKKTTPARDDDVETEPHTWSAPEAGQHVQFDKRTFRVRMLSVFVSSEETILELSKED